MADTARPAALPRLLLVPIQVTLNAASTALCELEEEIAARLDVFIGDSDELQQFLRDAAQAGDPVHTVFIALENLDRVSIVGAVQQQVLADPLLRGLKVRMLTTSDYCMPSEAEKRISALMEYEDWDDYDPDEESPEDYAVRIERQIDRKLLN